MCISLIITLSTHSSSQVVSGGSELVVRGVTREDRGEFSCIVNLKQVPLDLLVPLDLSQYFCVNVIFQQETPTLRHSLEVLGKNCLLQYHHHQHHHHQQHHQPQHHHHLPEYQHILFLTLFFPQWLPALKSAAKDQ